VPARTSRFDVSPRANEYMTMGMDRHGATPIFRFLATQYGPLDYRRRCCH
jgi:hypothetical protein